MKCFVVERLTKVVDRLIGLDGDVTFGIGVFRRLISEPFKLVKLICCGTWKKFAQVHSYEDDSLLSFS